MGPGERSDLSLSWCPLMSEQLHLFTAAEGASPLCAKLSCLPKAQPLPCWRICFRTREWMVLHFPHIFATFASAYWCSLEKGRKQAFPDDSSGACILQQPQKGNAGFLWWEFCGVRSWLASHGHWVLWLFCIVRTSKYMTVPGTPRLRWSLFPIVTAPKLQLGKGSIILLCCILLFEASVPRICFISSSICQYAIFQYENSACYNAK